MAKTRILSIEEEEVIQSDRKELKRLWGIIHWVAALDPYPEHGEGWYAGSFPAHIDDTKKKIGSQ